MPLTYTVAICTWNRAAMLRDCLLSVAHQEVSPAHDIMVVDNASTDSTQAVVAELAIGMSKLRYVREPRLGLSHARNRALTESAGDVVAFLDDDARADPGWLRSVDRGFNASAHAGAVGGPIRLVWATPPPRWFPNDAALFLGERDLGAEPRALPAAENPRGANFAVRRRLAIELGGFRTDLGRVGRSLLSGEDDAFLESLRTAGHDVRWDPGASIAHLVGTERITMRWMLRRAWMQGLSEVQIEAEAHESGRRIRLHAALNELGHAATTAGRVVALAMRRRRDWSDESLRLSHRAARAYTQARLATRRAPHRHGGAAPSA